MIASGKAPPDAPEPGATIAFAAGIIRLEAMVPMRDGVHLATDIYLPADREGPLPVLLERTPYGKRGSNRADRTAADPEPRARPGIAADFARAGYGYVLQDCRGRFASEGCFTKYLSEDTDGFDTLAWLVKQDWCNGSIGTLGLSYGAHVQTALAAHDPPGLAAMFLDSGGFSNAYTSGIRQGGAFELKQVTWAMRHALIDAEARGDEARLARLRAEDIGEWITHGARQEGATPLASAPRYEAFVLEQWRRELLDEYWLSPALGTLAHICSFADVPIVLMASWYDPYVRSAVENFIAFTSAKRSPVRLLLGPWTHGQRSVTYSGEVDFGEAATLDSNIAPDYTALRLAWFDRHMKHLDAPDYLAAPVTFFVMGGGSGKRLATGRLDHGGFWAHAAAWPIPDALETAFYLGEQGLSTAPGPAGAHRFRYDPADPVPTIGGAIASGAPLMEAGAFDQRERPSGRETASRPDVLVFETAPLERAVTLVGTPRLCLWISSDRPDSDITIKLVDVYPPGDDYPRGFAMNLTHGILRLRFRNSFQRAEMLQPGMRYPVKVEAFPTANLFAAGHRIRLEISSSNFPHFDINPNTGAAPAGPGATGEPQVAINHVYFGGDTPSRLLLPLLPGVA